MGLKLIVIKDCINQDTGKALSKGDIVEFSEMEASRHLAEGNCKIYGVETAARIQPETRIKRGKR